MTLASSLKLLRKQWIIVCGMIVLAVAAAGVITALTPSKYQASTRLFVSTSSGSTLSDAYQGSRFSQERVVSYTDLLMGETLAQRTVDKLRLDTTAKELQANVTAKAKAGTVLITVDVLDESPVRARDIANALSDEFVVMIHQLEAPEDGTRPDSRVVVEQRASIPEDPVIPNTLRNIGLGLLLGIGLGIGIAVLRDMLDNSVKGREDVDRITGKGIVGTIPLAKELREQPIISFDGDMSRVAESFRKLRTNLQFLSVDHPPRVITVTSSLPGEGKSTTSLNIALALAEADHSVVLVDGDLRRPTLHTNLDLVGQVGFSTVLSSRSSLSESLQNTRFPNLTVLTAGAIPPNPSELLGSQAAKNLIEELRTKFDYVIIDSTPLLAVTDAAILGAAADGVLIVVRYGRTSVEQLQQAVDALNDVEAPLLGTVITQRPTTRNASGYYGYSGYYGLDQPNRIEAKNATEQPALPSPASEQARPVSTEDKPTASAVIPEKPAE